MKVTVLFEVLLVFLGLVFFGGGCLFVVLGGFVFENYRIRCTKEMGFLKSVFMQTVEGV